MSEPATARAMAFRVEDMEREDRVEALTEWGEAREEAGRREIEAAACLRGQHVARRPGGCACGHMPPLGLDDAPGPVVTSNFEATAPPLSPKEQADIISSLVYQLAAAPEPAAEHDTDGECLACGEFHAELGEDVTHEFDIRPKPEPNVFEQIEQGAWRDPLLTPEPELGNDSKELRAEQPSSLVERTRNEGLTMLGLVKLAGAIDADRVRLDNLDTKTAHLPFPAAPEPGA